MEKYCLALQDDGAVPALMRKVIFKPCPAVFVLSNAQQMLQSCLVFIFLFVFLTVTF